MSPGTGKNILIIDDEMDILTSLSDFLSRHGYYVSVSETGIEGLKIAKKEVPQLIILDLMLPDVDGSDVAVELLQDPVTRDIPIIFLTSVLTRVEQEEAGMFIGNRCIIAKPCRLQEILAVIQNRLGFSR